jgi:hypothetical protein
MGGRTGRHCIHIYSGPLLTAKACSIGSLDIHSILSFYLWSILQPLTMSFTSPTGQFKPYQAFGSGSSSTKPPAQSFSSRVDFSDQSYDMTYFAGSGVYVSNPQTNYASTAPKQPVADAPRGFTLKQLSDAPKTKSFDKKGLSSIPNTSQQGTCAIRMICAHFANFIF